MKNFIKHWKTTTAGLLVGVLTLMLYTKKLNVQEWATGLGAIATAVGLLAKDWDKTNEK